MKIGRQNQQAMLATRAAVILAVVVALVFVGGSTKALAQSNLVYVESNIIGANGTCSSNCNSVFGFSNDGAGNLTPLNGSPYLTGGVGVFWDGIPGQDAGVDADQQLIINPKGTLLFAVNGDTNTIAAFTINSDGSLTAVSGSPFASNGSEPISLGFKYHPITGDILTVANKASDPNQGAATPNYTSFKVSTGGAMTLIANSTYNLASGASPSQVLTRPGGSLFIGIEFLSNTVASYQLNPNGTITQISKLTPPGANPSPLGGVFHPTKQGLYVGLPAENQVAVYVYNTSGVLSLSKVVSNQGSAVCWLAVNPAGTRLYTSETASGTLTVYDITLPSVPKQLQHMAVTGTGALPTNLALDPTGNFLYVVDRLSVLHVINVLADGTLSETITPVPLPTPAGTTPFGLAVLSLP
jgi:6-phosphogluconolactonase (cycloisomerase 2 family)